MNRQPAAIYLFFISLLFFTSGSSPMFSFLKRKIQDVTSPAETIPAAEPQKRAWLSRLKTGLTKTSSSFTRLFVGAKIDDNLYEELEAALLMSDAGVEATQWLLDALKRQVKEDHLLEAEQVKKALH